MISPIINAQEPDSTAPQTEQVAPTNSQTETAEVSTELSELVVIPNVDFVADDLKTTIEGLEYQSVTIKSEYTLGTETQTDFMVKQSNEDTTNIERELDNHRTGFLHNLENAPSVTKDKPEIKKASKEDIDAARDKINKDKSIIKEAKFLVKNEQKENTLKQLQQNKKLKEVKDQQVKKETPQVEQTQPFAEEPKVENSIKEQPKKLNYWMDKLNPTIKVQAQASQPAWVPDFSSVNFFDTDEVGTWVHSNWSSTTGSTNAQPSVTHGNGRMYVAIKTPANKVAVGNFDSNGNDPKPFVIIGDTTQSPTIEFYYGRIYVGIIGANNIPQYKFSADGGVTWSAWTTMGGTVLGLDFERLGNSLYAGARGTDNRIYMNRIDNGVNTWTGWVVKGTQTTIDKPVLAAHNVTVYFGYRATNNKAMVNRNAINWVDTNNKEALNITNSSFGMASIGSQLCFIFKANINDTIQGCSNNDLANPPFLINSNITSIYPPAIAKDWNLNQLVVGNTNTLIIRNLGLSLGTRGFITEMMWDTDGFNANDTYEQEVYLYAYENSGNYQYDRKTYLTKADTGSITGNCLIPGSSIYNSNCCIPTFLYWTSSLPNPYLDTRLDYTLECDSVGGEVSYTIGSGNANNIVVNKTYYNYYIANDGDLSKPVFKLQSQYGRQVPAGCYSTGCSYEHSAPARFDLISYSSTNNLDRTGTYPYWYKTFNK